MLDPMECDRARLARDPAYDGRFYTGVRITGVYCRPVCVPCDQRNRGTSSFSRRPPLLKLPDFALAFAAALKRRPSHRRGTVPVLPLRAGCV
jgi:hypothetical protein